MLKAASCVIAAAFIWNSGSTTAWGIKNNASSENNAGITEFYPVKDNLAYSGTDSNISLTYSDLIKSLSENEKLAAATTTAATKASGNKTTTTASSSVKANKQTTKAAVTTVNTGKTTVTTASTATNPAGLSEQTKPAGNSSIIPDPVEADLTLGKDVIDNDVFRKVADDLGDYDEVFRFVKDNIRNEMYTGSKKGALLTLAQLGGNDIDQASLLVSLLRAKDIPARFVRGTVRITPQQALAFTGAADLNTATDILSVSFRNPTVMQKDNVITGFVFEHTWAEAYVPYTEYRGAGGKGGESIWIPLDPSFKKLSRSEGEITPEYTAEDLARFDEMKSMAAAAPDVFTGSYDAPGKLSIFDYEIKNNREKYLPSSLPYTVNEISERYDAIKDADKQSITIRINDETLLDIPVADLCGRYINISYEPASDADAQVIAGYDKITDVPAASVNVVPVVTVGNEKFRSAFSCHLGDYQTMTIIVNDDTGSSILNNTLVSGSIYAVNFDLNLISSVEGEYAEEKLKAAAEKRSTEGMYSVDVLGAVAGYAGRYYFTLCDAQDQIYAAMENVYSSRHLAVAVTGYQFDTRTEGFNSEFLDTGHFFIDVAYNCTTSINLDGDKQKARQFNLETGMAESNFEDYIWTEITGTDKPGVSTLSVMAAAAEKDIAPVYITAKNADAVLSECSIDEYIKDNVRNCASEGKLVILIPEIITIGDWTGTSYIAMEPETGIASFMLSDGTAGGASQKVDLYEDTVPVTDVLISLNIQLSYINRAIAMINAVKMFGAAAEAEEGDLDTPEGAAASIKALRGVVGAAAQYGYAVQMELDMCDLILRYVDENLSEAEMEEILIDKTRENLKKTLENLYYLAFSKNKLEIFNDLIGHIGDLRKDGNEYIKVYNIINDLTGLA